MKRFPQRSPVLVLSDEELSDIKATVYARKLAELREAATGGDVPLSRTNRLRLAAAPEPTEATAADHEMVASLFARMRKRR